MSKVLKATNYLLKKRRRRGEKSRLNTYDQKIKGKKTKEAGHIANYKNWYFTEPR
jgi:hypothetical protein